jgi:hypothetical protein
VREDCPAIKQAKDLDTLSEATTVLVNAVAAAIFLLMFAAPDTLGWVTTNAESDLEAFAVAT